MWVGIGVRFWRRGGSEFDGDRQGGFRGVWGRWNREFGGSFGEGGDKGSEGVSGRREIRFRREFWVVGRWEFGWSFGLLEENWGWLGRGWSERQKVV
jgi:hypothetical protein